jgi:hypothetical protein
VPLARLMLFSRPQQLQAARAVDPGAGWAPDEKACIRRRLWEYHVLGLDESTAVPKRRQASFCELCPPQTFLCLHGTTGWE